MQEVRKGWIRKAEAYLLIAVVDQIEIGPAEGLRARPLVVG